MKAPTLTLLLVFTLAVAPLSTAPAALLTWWQFDEPAGSLVAADSSGNANDGNLLNFLFDLDSDFDPAGGKFGGAIHFDGFDDYINNTTGFQPGGNFTYAYFFKPDEADYTVGHVRDDHIYSNARPHFSFSRDAGDGTLGMYATIGADTQVKTTTNLWSNTEWHFVAFTYDGTNFKVYVNGVEEGSIPLVDAHTVQGDGRFNLGSNAGNTATSFDGYMDELNIWDEALGAADLAFISENGVQLFLDARATDSDDDGLPDIYEQLIIDADEGDAIMTLADVLPGDDFDNDGSTNEAELANNTDPIDDDSDDDGLLDGPETNTGTFANAMDTGTDPNRADTDGDGISDGDEVAGTLGFVTDPTKADTDGDGFRDKAEIDAGSDPTNPASNPGVRVNILFIGGQAGPTQGADATVMTFLEDRYGAENVTYKQASQTAAGEENAFGVLVISSTPGSGDMRNKFHNSTIPVVNWEEAIADNGGGEFMITAGRPKDNVATDHVITILEDHPITAGFDVGQDVTISTGQCEVWWSSGQQAPGALSLANEMGDATRLFLTTVDAGGELNDGSATPARRVMLGMTDNTFDAFTDDGKTLVGQSIDWALGISGEPDPLRILEIDYDTDANLITLTWNSKPGKFYSIDTSLDLAAWPGDIDDSIAADSVEEMTSFTFSADALGGRTFFRVRLSE